MSLEDAIMRETKRVTSNLVKLSKPKEESLADLLVNKKQKMEAERRQALNNCVADTLPFFLKSIGETRYLEGTLSPLDLCRLVPNTPDCKSAHGSSSEDDRYILRMILQKAGEAIGPRFTYSGAIWKLKAEK